MRELAPGVWQLGRRSVAAHAHGAPLRDPDRFEAFCAAL
jgi:hypothetical protein